MSIEVRISTSGSALWTCIKVLVGIVARRATRRVSVGRSVLIWVNLDPDPGEPNKEISKTRTTSKGQKDRKPERGQPL